jgi:hypothetical protein
MKLSEQASALKVVWVAKSTAPSSSLFHEPSKVRFLSPHRQASSLGLGTLSTDWTSPADGKAKLDFDDLLIARPGGCPTATGLPLWTAGLFVFPVN